MPERLREIAASFNAQSVPVKIVLIVVVLALALGLLVLLSPIVAIIGTLGVIASLIVMVIRGRQGRPLRQWVWLLVAAFILTGVFGNVSQALYGWPSGANNRGQAVPKDDREQVAAETTEETTTVPEIAEPTPSAEEDGKPEPKRERSKRERPEPKPDDTFTPDPPVQPQFQDPVEPAPAPISGDYDCSNFGSKVEAQPYLLPGDPYGLDRDGDGQACDSLP